MVGLVVVALLLLAALRSAEVPQAIDGALQSTYYRIANDTSTEQRVLLVEADPSTVEEWGSPGWELGRWNSLLERIAEGHPKAIVVVDGQRMVRGDVVARSHVVDVPRIDLTTKITPRSSGVDSVDNDDLPLARLSPVLDALELPPLSGDRLWIHYLWPQSRLPSLTFQHVEQQQALPASVFEDKVVVVGLTSETHRDRLPTPVGHLTSPEIVSHALAMLIDGRGWHVPSPLLRILGLVLVVLVTVASLRGTTPSQGLVRAAAIGVALVLLDLLLFSQGLLLWGVASELMAVLVAVLGHWYLAQQSSVEMVESVSERVAGHLTVDVSGPQEEPDGYWQDMAEVVRAYLDVPCSGVIAELPAGRWHLRPRAFMGMSEEDIVERRRDVRRPPYRAAFLTHKPSRCERPFVDAEGQWTLAVPLAYQGRLYGMWMVCFDADTELDLTEKVVIEGLGTELGRRIADGRRGLRQSKTVISAGDIPTRLSQLEEGLQVLDEDKQQVVDTFDSLPVGLLVADVFGHITRVNDTLREQLDVEFPDGVPGDDIAAVLSRITGRSLQAVQDIMRSVVRTGEPFRVRPAKDDDRWTTYLLIPMRSGSAEDSRSGKGTTRLVLMAVPDDRSVEMLMHSA